jgi:hypothetical protein
VQDGKVTVQYTASAALLARHPTLYLVLTDDHESVPVRGGENGGRTLQHAAVARAFESAGTLEAEGGTAQLPEPPANSTASGGRHVTLFAQESGQRQVLAVDTAVLQHEGRAAGAGLTAAGPDLPAGNQAAGNVGAGNVGAGK